MFSYPTYASCLARCVALLTVSVAFSGAASAAERPARTSGLQRITNPFAVTLRSQLTSNPFGFPVLSATPVTAATTPVVSNPVTPAPVTAQAPIPTLDTFEVTPAFVVTRPPYRPPVRSPFRPPPRPPFTP
jgi:hypothetical protein